MGGLDELQRQLATRSTRSSAGEWRMSSRWAWCGGAEGERQRTGSQLLDERAGGRRVSDRTGDQAKGREERESVGGRGWWCIWEKVRVRRRAVWCTVPGLCTLASRTHARVQGPAACEAGGWRPSVAVQTPQPSPSLAKSSLPQNSVLTALYSLQHTPEGCSDLPNLPPS